MRRQSGTDGRVRAIGRPLDTRIGHRKKSIALAGVSLEGKRAMIEQLKESYPIERLCAVLGCPRSSYYYQAAPGTDEALVEAVEQLWLRKPFLGYRRIAAQLRREVQTVNTKRVRRILKELGVQRNILYIHTPTTESSCTRSGLI